MEMDKSTAIQRPTEKYSSKTNSEQVPNNIKLGAHSSVFDIETFDN